MTIFHKQYLLYLCSFVNVNSAVPETAEISTRKLRLEGVCWGDSFRTNLCSFQFACRWSLLRGWKHCFYWFCSAFSFGRLCPSFLSEPWEHAVAGTLHLIHISSFSKHFIKKKKKKRFEMHFLTAFTPVLLTLLTNTIRPDRNPRIDMHWFWRNKHLQTKGAFSMCSLLLSIRSAHWHCFCFGWLCHKNRGDGKSNASFVHGMSNLHSCGGLRCGGCHKITLFY